MEEALQQLVEYIKGEIKIGTAESVIKNKARIQGWDEVDFNKALQIAKMPDVEQPVTSPEVPRSQVMGNVSAAAMSTPSPTSLYNDINVESPLPVLAKVISILSFIVAILLIMFGILFAVGGLLFTTVIADVAQQFPIFTTVTKFGSNMFFLAAGLTFIFGVLLFTTAKGLWEKHAAARIFFIILLLLPIVRLGMEFAMQQTFEGAIPAGIAAIVILYLLISPKVRRAFASESSRRHQGRNLTIAIIFLALIIAGGYGGSTYVIEKFSKSIEGTIETATQQLQETPIQQHVLSEDEKKADEFFQKFIVAISTKDSATLTRTFGYAQAQLTPGFYNNPMWKFTSYKLHKADLIPSGNEIEKNFNAYFIVPSKTDETKFNVVVITMSYSVDTTAFIGSWQVHPTIDSPQEFATEAAAAQWIDKVSE